MLEPRDDLNSFARGDNLDIAEAFQIKRMPISGNDQKRGMGDERGMGDGY